MQIKSLVLVYCAEPEQLSAMAFALRLHPYDVIAVKSANHAMRLCKRSDIRCGIIVHEQRGDYAGRLVHRILEAASHMPLLLVDRVGDLAPIRYADMVLYGANTTMAHVLAALRVLCAPKTGVPHAR